MWHATLETRGTTAWKRRAVLLGQDTDREQAVPELPHHVLQLLNSW